MSVALDLPTFISRWQASTLTERSAAQQRGQHDGWSILAEGRYRSLLIPTRP